MNSILRSLLLIGIIVCVIDCHQGSAATSGNQGKKSPINMVAKEKNTPPNDAFWQAIRKGTVKEVRHYIEKENVDVNTKNKAGMTPLHLAVVFDSNIDMTKYLIEKGADVNAKSNEDWTPLHFAAPLIAVGRSSEAAICLLENGADAYAKNSDGKTPLDFLIEVGGKFVSETSLDLFRKLAERGDPKAMFNMGNYCLNVDENYHEAMEWFRKAAELGHTDAQTQLGLGFLLGPDAERNYPEGVKWLRKAADIGDADAQLSLAVCYFEGIGVEQDIPEGIKWLQKSATQGQQDAINMLRQVYEEAGKE